MPLDYCHPTAPHKKLKLPEWYVSSLMMDRALDAICRRVKTLDRKQIDAAAEREITFPLGGTNKGQMKGDDYLNHFMLPNFYFHCTAAYAILRHCGVDVGKRDFLGAIPLKMV